MSTATSTATSTSTYTSLVDDATTSYLEAVGQLNGVATTVLDAVKAVAEKLPRPAAPAPLPTVSELLTANFAAVERLLATQKAFALQLAAAVPAPAVVVPQQVKPTGTKASATA